MSAAQRGLGRGFDSLIPTEVTPDVVAAIEPVVGDEAIQLVPVDSIDPNPHQPRRRFNDDELSDLADSIKSHGIMQPLVAVVGTQGRHQLVAGERRLRAAKRAGLTEVPVIVRSYDQQTQLELALIENLQRAELNPIETAQAYKALMEQFNLSLDQLSGRVGKAKSTVSNAMRLLGLSPEARQLLVDGKLNEGQARALLAVTDARHQAVLADQAVRGGWTVRQIEQATREHKLGVPAVTTKRPVATNATTEALAARLKLPVKLQPTAKGGKVVITYKSDEELERIQNLLG